MATGRKPDDDETIDVQHVDVRNWRFGQEPNNWLTPTQQAILASYFDEASLAIVSRLNEHPNVHEVTLTDLLCEDYLSEGPKFYLLMSALEHNGLHIEVEGKVMSIPEEAEVGADLGIVLHLRTKELSVEKAILLQAKKLSSSKSNAEYNDLLTPHGRKQGRRMSKVTAASFFVLYNPLPVRPIEGFQFVEESPTKLQINFSDPVVRGGVGILPVTTQLGLRIAPQMELVYPYTLPLTNFIVDDFMQCKVGDSRRSVLQIASAQNERFRVRRSVSLFLSTAD